MPARSPQSRHPIATILGALLFAAGSAQAVPVAYEGFDYAAGGNIFNLGGGSGWTSTWGYLSSLPGTISASGLSHGGLDTAGNALATPVKGPADEVGVFVRNLPAFGQDGTTLFMSFLLRPEAGFGFYGGVNFGNLFIGKSGGAGDTNYGLEGPLGDVDHSATPVTAGQTVLLVLLAQFQTGNDLFELYVDPPVGGGLPPTPSAVKSDYDAGLASFLLVNNAGAYTTDELRIGTTYADVVPASGAAPVSEPDVLALIAAGLAGLPRFGSRKKSPNRSIQIFPGQPA